MPDQRAVFDLMRPERGDAPLVVDAPHAGHELPDDFDFICNVADLRRSEDSYADHFAQLGTAAGATVLCARINRAYIDLNRALSDLHPDVCADQIPWPTHRTKRSSYGMGLVRHLIRPGVPVYGRKLTLADIQHRITHIYDPYYAALENALRDAHTRHGRVLHINLHAMPAIGADGHVLEDIILGDHDGHSCGRPYRDAVRRVFEKHGLKVVVNHPYKGVELTRRFARPRMGFHSLQIEVNKALYMNEQTLATHDGFDALCDVFADVWKTLAEFLGEQSVPRAAE